MGNPREITIPLELDRLSSSACVYYGYLQLLDRRKDVERDGLVVFIVGPKQWKKLGSLSQRSVQTLKRWLGELLETGWASVERINKATHRVTLYFPPVREMEKNDGPTKPIPPVSSKGDSDQP
jgi:hypothetical protein